jgi:hypothetical protein
MSERQQARAEENGSGTKKPVVKTAKSTHWHPAVEPTMRAEMIDYIDIVKYDGEVQMNVEPLRVDGILSITDKSRKIEKNIGMIFRGRNIIEFKSPTDGIDIAGFHLAKARAELYMSINGVPADDVTITIVQNRFPREVFKYIKRCYGFQIRQQSAGIYYVEGGGIPMQVLVTAKLPRDENMWLRGLGGNLNEAELEKVLVEADRLKGKMAMDPYLHVVVETNPDAFRRLMEMRKSRQTLERIMIETGFAADMEARGEARRAIKDALRGIERRVPAQYILAMTGLPDVFLGELFDQKESITLDEAYELYMKEYVDTDENDAANQFND